MTKLTVVDKDHESVIEKPDRDALAAERAQAILGSLDFGDDFELLFNATEEDLAAVFADGTKAGLRLLTIDENSTTNEARARFGLPPIEGGDEVPLIVNQVNDLAVEWARTRSAELVTQISENTRDMLRSTVTQAIEEGWGAAKLADELEESAGFSAYRAERIARTECLLGETPVSAAVIRAVFRRWYHGEIVEIVTAEGRKFATTPNHPMLTRRGGVVAGEITDLDYLVCDARQKHLGAHGDENVNARPAAIAELFDTLSVSGTLERRSGNRLDFHGDGRDGDVEIARLDRELHLGRFAALYKPTIQDFLPPSDDVRHADFCPLCGRLLAINESISFVLRSERDASILQSQPDGAVASETVAPHEREERRTSFVGDNEIADRNVIAISRGSLSREPQSRCVVSVACDVCLVGGIKNLIIGNAETLGDQDRAETGFVELDHVVSTSRREFSGHVFNLETPYGYFCISSGAYTGNTIRANNQGNLAAYKSVAGICTGKVWSTAGDDLVCEEICSENEDEGPIGLDDDFPSGDDAPPGHPNCIPAGVLVTGRFEAATRSYYVGPIVEITTRSGAVLPVTPNHPVFTADGSRAAAELRVGDYVLSYSSEIGGYAMTDRDKKNAPRPIEQIFGAFREAGSPLRIKSRAADFHGDATFFDSDVEIVVGDLELLTRDQAGLINEAGEFGLVTADMIDAFLVRLGAKNSFGKRHLATESGCVGGDDLGAPVGVGHSGPLQSLGRRTTARDDISLDEARSDRIACNADSVGNSFLRKSLRVEGDDFCVGELQSMSAGGDSALLKPSGNTTHTDADFGEFSKSGAGEILIDDTADLVGGVYPPGLRWAVGDTDTSLGEPPIHGAQPDACVLRDLGRGFPGSIFADEIIDVRLSEFSGHVYDLQSDMGIIIAHGLLLRNCRCTILPWTEPLDESDEDKE